MTQPHMAFGFGAGGAGEAGLLRGRWAAPHRWEGPLLQAGCTHQEGLPWAHDPESVACQSAWASRSLSVGLRLRSRCSRGLVPTGPRGPPSLCGLHAIPRKGRAKGVCRAGPPEGERQERVLAGGVCCTAKQGQIRGVISSGSRAPLGAHGAQARLSVLRASVFLSVYGAEAAASQGAWEESGISRSHRTQSPGPSSPSAPHPWQLGVQRWLGVKMSFCSFSAQLSSCSQAPTVRQALSWAQVPERHQR